MLPVDHPRIPDLNSHPGIDDLVGMEKKRGRGQSSRTGAPWSASGRSVASPWLPCTVPPLSPATPRPSQHRTAPLGHGIRSPRTPHTRSRACPAPPKPPQRAHEAAPLAELAPCHPAPLRHASLVVATADADRRRGSPHPRVAAILCRTETVPTVEHLTERWTRTVPS